MDHRGSIGRFMLGLQRAWIKPLSCMWLRKKQGKERGNEYNRELEIKAFYIISYKTTHKSLPSCSTPHMFFILLAG